MRLEQLKTLAGQPLAIDHRLAGQIVEALRRQSLDPIAASLAEGEQTLEQKYQARGFEVEMRHGLPIARRGAVAVIPIMGHIDHRDSFFFGGTSVTSISGAIDEVLGDNTITEIVGEFDTGGGSVFGIDELATKIRNSRGIKRMTAAVNAWCASAGYYLASQFDDVTITPSGQVGSIGVVAAHFDISKMLEEEGVKVTLIHAGRFKVEGNTFEELGDEARAEIQASVDGYFDLFVKAVAAGRGVKPKLVRGPEFGEGRMFSAKDSVKAGLADRVEPFDATITRLTPKSTGAKRARPSVLRRRRDLRARST